MGKRERQLSLPFLSRLGVFAGYPSGAFNSTVWVAPSGLPDNKVTEPVLVVCHFFSP